MNRLRPIVLTSALVNLLAFLSAELPAHRDWVGLVASAQAATVALPDCGQAGAAPLSATLFPFHEDSSIQTRIDLGALNPADYLSLGVIVAKEDGVDYFPGAPGFSVAATLRELPPDGCLDRAFSHLNAGKTYEICLIGINADFTSTGLFACVSVETKEKKRETALLITNSNTTPLDCTIDAWISKVKDRNPRLTIREAKVSKSISVEKLYESIRRHYLGTNLTTVILGSPGLPLPVVDNFGAQVSYSGAYTTLSRGFMVDDGFFNPTNDLFEVTIASWRTPSNKILKRYLNRVIDFYDGDVKYDRRLLVANAMTPDELPLVKNDVVDVRYPANMTDYVGGITKYLNDAQGIPWRERYASLLSERKYELALIEAHGSTTFHYPCDSGGCVDAAFVRLTNLRAQVVVAVSVAAFGAYALRMGHRVAAAQRFPSPGTVVIRDTRVVTGRAAELLGRGQAFLGGALIVLAAALLSLCGYGLARLMS